MKVFEPYAIKNLQLRNRIVMPPMCMYSADSAGRPGDFHFSHYTARAVGGAGLIIMEAAGVIPNGRISDEDLGIWDDYHIEGLAKIVDSIKAHGAAAAIQLQHAGRKYMGKSGPSVAPSPLSHDEKTPAPKELTISEIRDIIKSFGLAAGRAHKAGFDAIELHGAHGYLIHQFLSALSNHRRDEYGGSLEKRARFLGEVLEEVNGAWPKDKTILLRVSASDYLDGGITPEEMARIINIVKGRLDIVHVSSGGLLKAPLNAYPGYQAGFAETIKNSCGVPVIAVGLIAGVEMAEEIIRNNRADLVAFGRDMLRNPNFALTEAYRLKEKITIPKQYERGFF